MVGMPELLTIGISAAATFALLALLAWLIEP
jgi:hypothetical protein